MKESFSARYGDLEEWHWWFRARREILRSVLSRLPRRDNERRILSAGCGHGKELEMLDDYGTVTGFDLNREAVKRARTSGRSVLSARFPRAPFRSNSFDWICLFDVLEHVKREEETLFEIHRLLKPEGKLILTVPAFSFLWSGHDVVSGHERRYTRSQLIRVLKSASFSPVYISFFNCLLFTAVWAVRMVSRFTQSQGESGFRSDFHHSSPGLKNEVLFQLFRLEKHVLPGGHLPVGVSLLTVAEPLPKNFLLS